MRIHEQYEYILVSGIIYPLNIDKIDTNFSRISAPKEELYAGDGGGGGDLERWAFACSNVCALSPKKMCIFVGLLLSFIIR